MKKALLAFLLIAAAGSVLPARCPAEVVFTARPAVTGAVQGVPVLVELRWENRGAKTEVIDLGPDQRGGIVLIGSDGAAHRNDQAFQQGGLVLIPTERLAPGKSYTKVITLDEWGSPVEGRHAMAFRMSKHPFLIAKMDLDVRAYSPEAAKAVLTQCLRAANESQELWPGRAYLEAAGIFAESSPDARKLVIACCEALQLKNMPAKLDSVMRERRSHLNAID